MENDPSMRNTNSDPTQSIGNMEVNRMPNLGDFALGHGSINPSSRNDYVDGVPPEFTVNFEKVDEMLDRLQNGEFLIAIDSDADVPAGCVDGRLDVNGVRAPVASSAGGTYGLYIAKLFSSNLINQESEQAGFSQVVDRLKNAGKRIGVHGDDHGDCGCGACYVGPTIVEYMAHSILGKSKAMDALNVGMSKDIENIISEKAKEISTKENFFGDRAEVLKSAQDTEGMLFEKLVGSHKELAVFVNYKAGTTVDRKAIREAYGDNYDVFVVDAWSFGNAAEVLCDSEAEKEVFIAALTAYNVATASQLSDKSMPVVGNEQFALAG